MVVGPQEMLSRGDNTAVPHSSALAHQAEGLEGGKPGQSGTP